MKFEKKDIFTIPNILTYIRLIALPFFLWMMFACKATGNNNYMFAAFLIFVFAEITDVIDGHVARKYNMITDIGKVLDPTADKLLQCFSILTLAIVKDTWFVWIFMGILLTKEIFMGVSSKYFMRASKRQIEQKANKLGKAGATINFIGIIITFALNVEVILGDVVIPAALVKGLYIFDAILLLSACVLQLVAVTCYTVQYANQLKALRASGVLDTLDRYGNPLPKDAE